MSIEEFTAYMAGNLCIGAAGMTDKNWWTVVMLDLTQTDFCLVE